MSDTNHTETEALAPRRKKAVHERHQILPSELAAEPDPDRGLDWESVKHSVEFVKTAARELDGVELRDSDVYAIMYTPAQHQYFERYINKKA